MDLSFKRVLHVFLAFLLAMLLLPAFGAGYAKAEETSASVPTESAAPAESDSPAEEPVSITTSAPEESPDAAGSASVGGLVGIMPLALPPNCPTCHIGDVYGGSGWAGSYYVNGAVGYCVDPHMWYPVGNVFTPQPVGSDGYSMAFGWLLGWYDNPSQDEAIALSMLTAMHSPQFGGSGVGTMEQWNSFPHLQGLANTMWHSANTYAGPYSIGEAVVQQQPTHENDARVVATFHVANSQGLLWGGVRSNWFALGDTTNLTDITISQEGSTGRFWVGATVADTSQPWELWGRTTDWAPGGAQVHKAPSGSPMQDFIAHSWATDFGDPKFVEGDALKFVPEITTQTSSVLVGSAGSLTDKVVISGVPGMAGMSFTGRTSLYGPFATNDAAMAADVSSLTPVGVAEFAGTYDQDGNAQFVSDPVAYSKPGFYFWFEELDETDWVVGASQQPGGRVTETSLFSEPGIASVISADRIEDGTDVSDSLELSGLTAMVGDQPIVWTLDGGLYGPVAPGADDSCVSADWSSAVLVDPVSRVVEASEIQADGTVSLSNVGTATVEADGNARCVSYGWELTGVAPDGTKVSAVHAPGDPSQTGVITFQPGITTQAQAQVIRAEDLPLEISDLVVVFDGVAGASFEGRTSLYGPFATNADAMLFVAPVLDADGNETLTEDETSMLVGISQFEGVFDADGRAEFVSDPVVVSEFGYYLWIEELFERPDGSQPVEPTEPVQPCEPTEPGEPAEPGEPGEPGEPCEPGRPGRPSETLVVIDATIATQVNTQSAERGETISDNVQITGLVTRVGDGIITWSTDIQLFGPIDPNSAGTCENLDWSNVELLESTTLEITEDMIDQDGNVNLEAVGEYLVPLYGERGCLTYGETLTGTGPDGSVVKFTHAPGDPSQTTLVPWGGVIQSGELTAAPLLDASTAANLVLSIILLSAGGVVIAVHRRRSVRA